MKQSYTLACMRSVDISPCGGAVEVGCWDVLAGPGDGPAYPEDGYSMGAKTGGSDGRMDTSPSRPPPSDRPLMPERDFFAVRVGRAARSATRVVWEGGGRGVG